MIKKLSYQYNIGGCYKEKYLDTIKIGSETQSTEYFDKTHGYYIAVIQGFFQKFFYIRGAALSFIENALFNKYYKKWEDIILKGDLTDNVENRIIGNYCSGVFVPHDKVIEFLEDYYSELEIKKELDNLFSHERINVFLKALNFSKDNKLGILEATEVIEPNPMDLSNSSCYSNIFNWDLDGAILYQKAVMEQIAEIKNQQN